MVRAGLALNAEGMTKHESFSSLDHSGLLSSFVSPISSFHDRSWGGIRAAPQAPELWDSPGDDIEDRLLYFRLGAK